MLINSLITKAMFSSNSIVSGVSNAVYKNADKILLGIGISCVAGGTVSACLKTKTVEIIKLTHQAEMAKANAIEDKKERGKAKMQVYKNTAVDALVTFGPCVLLVGTGITAILGSHYILSRRYASLQVAYSMLDNSFREYRDRVRECVGKKKEYELYSNQSEIEVVEDDGTGKMKKTTEKVKRGCNSPYCFIFDEGNPNWQKSPELNKRFLEERQWYANDLLNRKKIVTLAEILYQMDFYSDMREIPTYAFDMIWEKGGKGDDEIIFGFQEDEGFMEGHDPSVMLNFNCDGMIRKLRGESMPLLKTANSEVA